MLREVSGEKLEETPAKEAGTRFPQFFSRFHAKLCMIYSKYALNRIILYIIFYIIFYARHTQKCKCLPRLG